MKHYLIVALLAALPFGGKTQRLSATIFAGTSNYQGDLQPRRFTFNQSHFAIGAGVLYELTEKLYARANFTYGTLTGDDKKNNLNSIRNLNFTSRVLDIHLGGEYHFFSLYERSITPYVFAGISYFHFNPKAIDSNGNKIALKPLSTEGQGFYQGRKAYNLNQFAIPFGGGLKMALNEKIRVGVELGLRKTFTDYIDDVSTTYVDRNLLLANRGLQAVDLAFRGDELKSGLTYPADGTQRGGAKFKDWYYFTVVQISCLLGTGTGGRSGGKNKTGCPARVY
jgi:opacity protein-like surface antigen